MRRRIPVNMRIQSNADRIIRNNQLIVTAKGILGQFIAQLVEIGRNFTRGCAGIQVIVTNNVNRERDSYDMKNTQTLGLASLLNLVANRLCRFRTWARPFHSHLENSQSAGSHYRHCNSRPGIYSRRRLRWNPDRIVPLSDDWLVVKSESSNAHSIYLKIEADE